MNILHILFAISGLLAVFSFLNRNIKDTFLASDGDGVQPLGLGIVLTILGFLVALFDYTGGYLLKGIGILIAVYGILVFLPNSVTNPILHPVAGFLYAVIAGIILRSGAVTLGVTLGHALTLVVPAFLAATMATVLALSLTSESFKDHLSQEDGGGNVLIIAGIIGLGVSLIAVNLPLMIFAAALGGLLYALGILVVADANQVKWLLAKSKIIAYAILTLVMLAIARYLF